MPDDTPAPPDLAAIAARRAAITGGQWPWMPRGVRTDYGDNVFVWAVAEGSEYYPVADQLAEGFGRTQICLITDGTDADWAFITAAPTDMAALLARIAALERALEHATLVIENYEMDIRNSAWTGVNLAAVGFCQGVIYRRALRTIQQLARATPPAATGE